VGQNLEKLIKNRQKFRIFENVIISEKKLNIIFSIIIVNPRIIPNFPVQFKIQSCSLHGTVVTVRDNADFINVIRACILKI